MRIAIFVWQLDAPGGAQRSALALKRYLQHDHEVQLFGIANQQETTLEDAVLHPTIAPINDSSRLLTWGVEFVVRRIEGYLRFRRAIARFNPDLLISQRGLSYAANRYSRRTGRPHICFVHGLEMIMLARGPLGDPPRPLSAYNRAFSRVGHAIARRTLQDASLRIVNSEFMRERIAEQYGIDSAVVYPLIDPEQYQVDSTGDAVLHVNPSFAKGIDTTLAVASELPDQRFLVAGSDPPATVRDRMESLDNVEFLGFVDDMRQVYRQTKIAIVPSKWEAFGRIPVEAGLNGIPAVCADEGGLPEAVGVPELVVETDDPSAYASRIRTVDSEYVRYSRLARRRATERLINPQLKRFKRIVDSELGIAL